jgi:phosphotransferase system IIB component
MAANPQVQEALISGLLGVVGGFLNNGKQMQGVAGIDVINDEAIQILDSLIKKGVSIEHLRKLDAMTNTKLKSLLIML